MKFFFRYPLAETRKKYVPSTDFSYSEVAATKGELPDSVSDKYNVDRYYTEIGKGAECFRKAKLALQRWQHFDLGWINIQAPAPVVDLVVPVVVRVFGIWTLNYCKVVYLLEERNKWGFAYGTLSTHGESGEERFVLSHNLETDVVGYEIVAFSRPNHWLAKMGYIFTRRLQRRFGRDSLAKIKEIGQQYTK